VKKRQRVENKESEVTLLGQNVPRKKLKKAEQALTLSELNSIAQCMFKPKGVQEYSLTDYIDEDMLTPPGIIVRTPPTTMTDGMQRASKPNVPAASVSNRHPQVTPNNVHTWNLPFIQFQSMFDINGELQVIYLE
jgi:hypothetical protein